VYLLLVVVAIQQR